MKSAAGFSPSLPPFLPADNQGLGSAETEQFVESLNEDLGQLLSQSLEKFWQFAANSSSLSTCLDSYVQFVRRPFDQEAAKATQPSSAFQQLSKRVLMVITRLTTPVAESIVKGGADTAALAQDEQARILQKQQLLSLPLLMDVCALYAPSNPALVKQLMHQAMRLLPELQEDLAVRIGPMIASNLRDVCQACRGAVRRMGGKGTPLEMSGLADGLLYMLDTAWTLHALVRAWGASAALLLGKEAALVASLAGIHDELLPDLANACHRLELQGNHASTCSLMRRHMQCLNPVLTILTAALVSTALLQRDHASAAQSLHDPFNGLEPAALGEALMTAAVAAAPSDDQPEHMTAQGAAPGLLRAAAARCGLASDIAASLHQGTILLDEVQQDYLFALLGTTSAIAHCQNGQPTLTAAPTRNEAPRHDEAEIATLISQIGDVLPEYGTGFLVACLEHFDWSAEQVINSLLEGSLPSQLQGLDKQAMRLPHSMQQPSSAANQWPAAQSSRGKALPRGAETEGPARLPDISWARTNLDSAAAWQATNSASSCAASGNSLPTRGGAPGPAPAKRVHKAVARLLEAPNAERDTARLQASAAQWEYDDEYDDSFDDLATHGNEGIADAEGEDEEAAQSGRRRVGQPGVGAGGPSTGTGGRSGGRQGHSQQPQEAMAGGRGRGRRDAGRSKLWVLDGRVYNYRKPGAVEVSGQGEAEQVLAAAQEATHHIHGLGPGGNKPAAAAPEGEAASNSTPGLEEPSGSSGSRPPSNADKRSHAQKDKHKGSIGNHHRKDRALRKMAGGP
ncbi:hypothetical protein WJX74_007126 [Apatococcus lobatus]|uniref:CUE domain-containing protein n=1 Tax=Apatococcus lobatus TaxID=904363 RepID=A0AAW1S7B9_9CHLO